MEPFLGEIRMFGFWRVPSGWRACDGSLLSIVDNQALFALLGTTYGGDGQTTFAVPDLRGRVPMSAGSGPGLTPYTLGGSGGSETVTLTAQQLAPHGHGYMATTQAASAPAPGPTLQLGALEGDTMYATGTTASVELSARSSTASGGSQPHENVMPTLAVQFCIALQGIFPPRD